MPRPRVHNIYSSSAADAGSRASQADVFEGVSGIIDSVMQGYNGTIMGGASFRPLLHPYSFMPALIVIWSPIDVASAAADCTTTAASGYLLKRLLQ